MAEWERFEQVIVRPVIGAAGAYEAIAIASGGRIPTITNLTHKLYNRPGGRVVLALVLGWVGVHLAEREVVRVIEEAVEEAVS